MLKPPTRAFPPASNGSREIRSIALINPLGDFGISQYTYELAEGLAANGVRVDVYANDRSRSEDACLPRNHRYLPVLGSLLLRQRRVLRHGVDLGTPPRPDQHSRRPRPTKPPARLPHPVWRAGAVICEQPRATARSWLSSLGT